MESVKTKILTLTAFLSLGLSTAMATPKNYDPTVINVEIYYESLCPDCTNLISGQLNKSWHELAMTAALFDVDMIPYGNAREFPNRKERKWDFQCQHGHKECLGNIIEACIINRVYLSHYYMRTLICMEGAEDPVEAAKGCIESHPETAHFMKWQDIEACAHGKEGNRLMHANALRTESLKPKHKYVPWLVFDGKHSAVLDELASRDLSSVICDLYKAKFGHIPLQCKPYFDLWIDDVEITVQ